MASIFQVREISGSNFVFFEKWERRINSIIIDNGISAACNTWLSSREGEGPPIIEIY
jgi:hypothetical protein